MSAYTSYVITEADKQLMLQRELRYMIKIEVLDLNYKILDSIEGMIVGGSYNIDSTSDVRRTTSFTINPTVLSDTSPMKVNPLGYVWFDKIIHLYIGLMDIRTEEFTYYSEGYYLFINAASSYDAQTNELNVTLNDYMCIFNAERNGQIGTPVIIPAYEYEESNDGHITILKWNLLRDAMKAVVVNLGKIPYDKVIVSEMGATNGLPELQENYLAYRADYPYWASVPYDLEFSQGTNVAQIVTELRDLYPNFETFFSPDTNNFVCQLIPSGYSDPITFDNDFIQNILISEQSAVDLTDVKNVCEVWGRVLNPKYYAPEAHNGNENILNLFEVYHEKLMTNLVDNFILEFSTNMTKEQEAKDKINTEIANIQSAIASDQATIQQLKNDVSVYEASVGKSVTLLREGKESFLNNKPRTYYNYPFAYHDHLGLMNSSDYSAYVTILTHISKTYRSRNTLNSSELTWFRKEKETLYTYAGSDNTLKARAANTYKLLEDIKNIAFTGEILNWCTRKDPQININNLSDIHVDDYLNSLGYKNRLIFYDDEKKVAFIERLVSRGDAAYDAYFGYQASLARSRMQEEIGYYGMSYYNAYKRRSTAAAQKASLETQRAQAQSIIQRMGSSSEISSNIQSYRDELQTLYDNLPSPGTYSMQVVYLEDEVSKKKYNLKQLKKNKASKKKIAKAQTDYDNAVNALNAYTSTYASSLARIQELLTAIDTSTQAYQTVITYEASSSSYDAEITRLETQEILPAESDMEVYASLINNDEAAMEASVSQIESIESDLASNQETLTELQTELETVTAAYNTAKERHDEVSDYKSIIINNYEQLDTYIQSNPSAPASASSKANAQAIIDAYEDIVSLRDKYESDSDQEQLSETLTDIINELSATIDNVRILLQGYIINTTGSDMFTYKIELDEYTKYSDGDEIAFKVNEKNHSPATFLQVNTLPILPIFRSKSLTDEAAINNFIEENALRKNVTYVFKIVNVETTRTNRITGEEETVSSLFAYLQGTYQLHGIDVLSDGREHTEPYMIQKQNFNEEAIGTSDRVKRIADGTDTSALIDETMQFDNTGAPEMEQATDLDGNPIFLYTREYFEYRYNCQNVHITVIPDSPYTIERLGEILDVKSGDRYDNCNTELEILENAIYENWKNCRLTDTVTITTFLCPFFDVNVKVTYKPRIIKINNTLGDDPSDDEPYEYLIKSVSHDLSGLTSTVVMYRYYPLFNTDNNYPTDVSQS